MNRLLLISPRQKAELEEFLPDSADVLQMANLFESLADETRLRILSCLSISPLCVGDISEILGTNQTTVSHALKILRMAGCVGFRRQGKMLVYEIKKKAICDVLLDAVHCL